MANVSPLRARTLFRRTIRVRVIGDPKLGFGHTKSRLPRRAVIICARGGKVFELLCKIASSPSNRRRADAADHSRSRRAADICVLETDLLGGQCGMAEEFTEKLIEKVREYVFLYDTGHPEYKNHFSLISFIHHRLLFLLQLSANRRRNSSS